MRTLSPLKILLVVLFFFSIPISFVSAQDADGDGVEDAFDNCRLVANPMHETFHSDGPVITPPIDSISTSLIDLDQDGDLDVFVLAEDGSMRAWVNDGAGVFTLSHTYPGNAERASIHWGDLDGDGDMDAFVRDHTAGSTVWLNDGTGRLQSTGVRYAEQLNRSTVLGDIDQDGDLDAVISTQETVLENHAVFFLNDGTGHFTQGSSVDLDNQINIQLTDLNSDGYLDLFAFGNSNAPTLAWLNDGAGLFTIHEMTPTRPSLIHGRGAYHFQDVNNDGDLDLFHFGSSSSRNRGAALYLNDGEGLFTLSPALDDFPDGFDTTHVSDFNADGSPDVLAYTEQDTLRIWLGNPFGVFTEHDVIDLAPRMSLAAHGDVNGDATRDLLILPQSTFAQDPIHLWIWTSRQPPAPDTDTDFDGTPDCTDLCPSDPTKQSPETCGCGVRDIDTDRDGTLDCLEECPNDPNKTEPGICGCNSPDIDSDNDRVLDCNDACPNDPAATTTICGCGLPQDPTDSDNDETPDCIDLCPNDPDKIEPGFCGCNTPDNDSDSDGVLDCEDSCVWIPNPLLPSFLPTDQPFGVEGFSTVALGDFDNDGDLDAFLPNTPLTIAYNDGHGNFTRLNNTPITQEPITDVVKDVVSGDFNNDGNIDLFVVYFGRADELWTNDGRGVFRVSSTITRTSRHGNEYTWSISAGDFNNDGALDVITTNPSSGDDIWFNNGDGTFRFVTSLQNTASYDASLGDFNRDGLLDIFLAALPDDDMPVRVWLNQGAGIFAPSGQNLSDARTTLPRLTDIDNDGDLDALFSSEIGTCIGYNDGHGIFEHTPRTCFQISNRPLLFGDANRDGRPDLFIGSSNTQPNTILLQDPEGTFSTEISFGPENNSTDIALGDFNGDGTFDVLTASFRDPGALWLGATSQNDPNVPNTDDDNDGTLLCDDGCPDDPGKTDPGSCGCGTADTDDDNDTVANCYDNCIDTPNTDQSDFDGDEEGDACDDDIDNDNVPNDEDSHPSNRTLCSDIDEDTCDDCTTRVFDPNNDGPDVDRDGVCDAGDDDDDNDTIPNSEDNCRFTPNPDQANYDRDLLGDACDDDDDNDLFLDTDELAINSDPFDADTDDDGVLDGEEGNDGALVDGRTILPSDDVDNDALPNVLDPDSDGDGLPDGLERGVVNPHPDTDTDAGHFIQDTDPSSSTNPFHADTDEDRFGDATEDANRNGDVDAGETDPNYAEDGGLDQDFDRVIDAEDNCVYVSNPDQNDLDEDTLGDVCDADIDGDLLENDVDPCPRDPNTDPTDRDLDGIPDVCDDRNFLDQDLDEVNDFFDNCPDVSNETQEDLDEDGLGDACDDDLDADAVENDVDNCPEVANETQADMDRDALGDACDDDIDGDGFSNDEDPCPNHPNTDPTDEDNDGTPDVCDDEIDSDGDGFSNADDNCPDIPNTAQLDEDRDNIGDACDDDNDNDTVNDDADNCPRDFNPNQEDNDDDGEGDACDFDIDGDTVFNQNDNCPEVSNLDQSDSDGDGEGDACDEGPNGVGTGSPTRDDDGCSTAPRAPTPFSALLFLALCLFVACRSVRERT